MPRLYDRNCDYCGKHYRSQNRFFCSGTCRMKKWGSIINPDIRPTSQCKRCHKKFKYQPSRSRGVFCSKKCEIMYREKMALASKQCRKCRIQLTEENTYNSKYKYWMNICKNCGNERNKENRSKIKLNPFKYRVRMIMTSLNNIGIKKTKRQFVEEWIERTKICSYCDLKMKLENYSVDHILPKSRGGANSLENLQLVCKSCNSMKGNLTDSEFRELLAFLADKPVVKAIIQQRLKASGWMMGGLKNAQ